MTAVSDAKAMARALVLARRGPVGMNPRVGCVVLDQSGARVGEGWHDGAGTPHAEVIALTAARAQARGGTAVVTLEPCARSGRTGPCVQSLLSAGISRVVYGRQDLNPAAAGGALALAAAGVTAELVEDSELAAECDALVARWAFSLEHRRPYVTWKVASTLDGRAAAPDGSSRWVTGPPARADVHRQRAERDVVLVGTGTVLADDPALTVRDSDGSLAARQPIRAVMGLRDLPPGARVLDTDARHVRLVTRRPDVALGQLWEMGLRDVWLEGGPTLAGAFVAAGAVDQIVAYVAPAILGGGVPIVADLGLPSIAAAIRFELVDVAVFGPDVRLTCRPQRASSPPP